MFAFICIGFIVFSDAVVGQASFSELQDDNDGNPVSFGSDILFTVTATPVFQDVNFDWKYKDEIVATVSRSGGSVTSSNSKARFNASGINIEDGDRIKLTLKLSNATIIDDNEAETYVESAATSSNPFTVHVKECKTNGNVVASIPPEKCGYTCVANLSCSFLYEGVFVEAMCQRNATFSDLPRCVYCNTSDINIDCDVCHFTQNQSVEVDYITPPTNCTNGTVAVCQPDSTWEIKTTASVTWSPVIECNKEWCTLDPKDIVSNNPHVRLICPTGKIGKVTAYRLEGQFYNVQGTCQDVNCTESQLSCGELNCTVKDPPYGYKDNVTADCPNEFYGNVTAVCGENNAYEEINSFCTKNENGTKNETRIIEESQTYLILPISLGVFGGSLLVGIVIGLFVNWAGIESNSQEFRLQLRLSPVKFVFLLIAFLVWGFAAGFLLFVYLAQYCKRKHKGQESNGDKRQGHEHQTTTN